jgi:hypothetical protein
MAREESEQRNAPMDRLKGEVGGLAGALTTRAVTSLLGRVEGTTGRLNKYVEGGAGPGLMAAITGAKGMAEGKSPGRSMLSAGMAGVKEKVTGLFKKGGRGGGGKKLKLTNIVESIDVGVPVTVAYNQWTQYNDFPKFTKKVESAETNKNEEQKVNWKAQVFWSHRTWEATIIEQVPDERIVWRSKGQKGHVDGAVTFHELGPNLTRILLILEYHPQGMFERTGNLWRAQGRRARLELKHIGRHMMTQSVLHPDEAEGWRGTIHDGEVTESHEDAVEREEQESSEREQQEGPEQEESRQGADGQADDEADGRDEESRPRRRAARATAGERGEGEDEEGEEGEGEESGNGRATAARSRSGRSSSNRSRSSSSRSSGNAAGGNGRRQRASATARRGGSK